MLLSEMFGVERDTDFGVEGLYGKFRVKVNTGYEFLVVSDGKGAYDTVVNGATVYRIIDAAPAGIIHLPPPLTDEQREQLKAIWTLGGRWLTKDKSGEVVTFSCKPEKNSYLAIWLPPNVMEMKCALRRMYGLDVCSLVSWSDHEPYDIGKALGVE